MIRISFFPHDHVNSGAYIHTLTYNHVNYGLHQMTNTVNYINITAKVRMNVNYVKK